MRLPTSVSTLRKSMLGLVGVFLAYIINFYFMEYLFKPIIVKYAVTVLGV
jgi:hypothetical protein